MSNSSGVFCQPFVSPEVRLQTWSFWSPDMGKNFTSELCTHNLEFKTKNAVAKPKKTPLRDGLEHGIPQHLSVITPISRGISPQLALHFPPFLRAMYLQPMYNHCFGAPIFYHHFWHWSQASGTPRAFTVTVNRSPFLMPNLTGGDAIRSWQNRTAKKKKVPKCNKGDDE